MATASAPPVSPAGGGIVFSVFQVQIGCWTRYEVAEDGGLMAGHHSGPEAGEDVIAVSGSALIEVLRGGLYLEVAREMGLIRGRGDGAAAAMGALREIVAA